MDIETLKSYLQISPFIRFMNVTIEAADLKEQELTMMMPMRAEFERGAGSGQFHGGPIAALIDTVGDFAVIAMIEKPVPTINFRVDYLRPATAATSSPAPRSAASAAPSGWSMSTCSTTRSGSARVGRGCYGTSGD